MSTKDGKQVWQIDVRNGIQRNDDGLGFSESPLVDGDLVFATPGGPDVGSGGVEARCRARR